MGFERYGRVICLSSIVLFTLACSEGGSSGSSNALVDAFNVSGSVGDGPIVGADIEVRDANGDVVATTQSDLQARYTIDLPGSTALPITVVASGGTDLVTERPADFELRSVISEIGEQTLNISPLTTLVTRGATCANDVSDDRISSLWSTIDRELNIGLDASVLGDPMRTPIDASNIETAVLANEALGEWIRRTSAGSAAMGIDIEQVVALLACDLGDGAMDGVLAGRVDGVDAADEPRVLAIAKAAEVAVRLEVLADRLEVDFTDSTPAMNRSINVVMPEAGDVDVRRVPITQAGIDQAVQALVVLGEVVNDPVITELSSVLASANRGSVEGELATVLDTRTLMTLQGLVARVAVSDLTAIDDLTDAVQDQDATTPPIISFGVSSPFVIQGGDFTLSWSTSGADRCVADAGWQGDRELEGTELVTNLQESTRFTLACVNVAGRSVAHVAVNILGTPPVAADPDPVTPPNNDTNPTPPAGDDPSPTPGNDVSGGGDVSVSLTANQARVASGASATLSWSSQNATSCTASGDWSGNRATSGQAQVGPLESNQTYSLTCQGPSGNAVALASIDVLGRIELAWQRPQENVDGTPAQAIDLYRLHYGTRSGEYDDIVEVNGRESGHTLELAQGDYFLAMTAVDQEGNESGLSNEVRRTAN